VYELTDWGLELEPVLQHLGRWGVRSPSMPRGAAVSAATLISAMRTMFHPLAAAGLSASYELRVGEDRFRARVSDGRLEIARGSAERPDATIEADTATLARLAFEGQPVAEELRAGTLTVRGDEGLVERFLGLFKLPEPVTAAS
jgi:alkyl sulfatase BDS1-like metallo-beta-lactamase superfamily hydrolase